MNWDVVHHPTYWFGSTTGELKRTELAFPHVPKGHPVFAQSMAIGNLVFVSGCTGQDTVKGTPTPDTIDGQMANGLNGAKAALETAGSSMERIVKTFILTRNASDYARIREIELDFYRHHAPVLATNPPPSTLIVVESLAKPEFLFEFEVIATVADDMPDWQRRRHEGVDVVGNFAIIAGCQPTSGDGTAINDDFDGQARAVLDRLRQRMEAAGSQLDGLIKTHLFVKDLADVERYRGVEQAYFTEYAPRLAKEPPASTAIVVEDLSNQNIQLEVDAFGVMASDDPNWPIEVMPGNAGAAASVSAGRLVFLSGIDGSDPVSGEIQSDNIEQQIIAALDKVKAAMEAAGSSLDKVVRTLMMLRRLDDYATMRSTEVSYYEKHAPQLVAKPPVSTFLQLPATTQPRALFQIDVIGWR